MSSKNIVNPDHYKIGGRDKPNEHMPAGKRPVDQQDEKNRERWQERQKDTSKNDKD
jgi:hypothetical protein